MKILLLFVLLVCIYPAVNFFSRWYSKYQFRKKYGLQDSESDKFYEFYKKEIVKAAGKGGSISLVEAYRKFKNGKKNK